MIRRFYLSSGISLLCSLVCFSFAYACDLTCQAELKQRSQVLLQNPADTAAREYFKVFGARKENENSKYHIRVTHINELCEYIDLLEDRRRILKQNNEKLKQGLSQDPASAALPDEAGPLPFPKTAAEELSGMGSPDKAIDHLRNFLTQKKNQLIKGVLALQKESGLLKKMQQRVLAESSENLPPLVKPQQKVSALTGQLAGKTLELMEKDSFLTEQKEDFKFLENSLKEAEERLGLVQRIIQEKDEKILVLQKDVAQMQALTQESYALNQRSIEDLKVQFVELHDDLKEQMSINQDKVSALENLLAGQEKKMAQYEVGMRAKSKKIEELIGQLQNKNKTLVETNVMLESQDKKIVELDGIVEIYKNKLSETNQLLREKNERIRSLETQSVDLR